MRNRPPLEGSGGIPLGIFYNSKFLQYQFRHYELTIIVYNKPAFHGRLSEPSYPLRHLLFVLRYTFYYLAFLNANSNHFVTTKGGGLRTLSPRWVCYCIHIHIHIIYIYVYTYAHAFAHAYAHT